MSADYKCSEIIFFLGAGASIFAGVPGTYAFVDDFINSIKDDVQSEFIEEIVSVLKNWKKSEIDIELLLETLVKLQNKEKEPLIIFCKDFYAFPEDFEIESLVNQLKNFIKTKTIVSEQNIHYLLPFKEFIEESKPIDILSVNYDTCIEQFCIAHKIILADGFDNYIRINDTSANLCPAHKFKEIMINLYNLCKKRALDCSLYYHTSELVGNEMNKIINAISQINSYLEPFETNRNIKFKDYINWNNRPKSKIQEIKKDYDALCEKYMNSVVRHIRVTLKENTIQEEVSKELQRLSSIIMDIEKNILQEIIKKHESD